MMPTTNITELRKNLFTTIDTVSKYNEPVHVTTKAGNAVILSEEDYNSLMETLYLLANPKLVERIKSDEKEDPETMEAFDPEEEW